MNLKKSIFSLILATSSISVTAAEPLSIMSCQDLISIEDLTTKTYSLNSDIDCHGFEISNPITFKGQLSGNNYTISGLSIKGDNKNIGLFSSAEGAYISDLTLEGITLESTRSSYGYSVGFLAGYTKGGNIVNVSIKNSTTVNQPEGLYGVGALTGRVIGTRLQNITGVNNYINTTDNSKKVGGLIGWMEENAWSNRLSVKESKIIVKNLRSGSGDIGGIFGRLEDSEVLNASVTDSSIYDSDNGTEGFNGMIVGRMIKSYISSSEVINVTANFRKLAKTMNNGIIAGYVISDENSSKAVLENISTNDADVQLPWFNSDPRKSTPVTTNLYVNESTESTLPPDICRL